MAELGEIVEDVRSKNAGPFWLTIDVLCGTAEVFTRVSKQLGTDQVAHVFGVPPARLKRFDIEDQNVVKFSVPRPALTEAPDKRDAPGASFVALLSQIRLPD